MDKNKKSQAWGIDLMAAIAIFSISIIIFFIYSINNYNDSEEKIEGLFYDGNIISDIILSESYPEDWDINNVIKIGILNNGKINNTKLERFYNLTQSDYSKTKNLFNTKYDYYFFLKENMTFQGGMVSIDGFGKPGINKNNITTENLIKITRFTIYKNKPIAAYLYIWE